MEKESLSVVIVESAESGAAVDPTAFPCLVTQE